MSFPMTPMKERTLKMADEKKALHVEVAEKLIEALKAGTAPWQKPWNSKGLPALQCRHG